MAKRTRHAADDRTSAYARSAARGRVAPAVVAALVLLGAGACDGSDGDDASRGALPSPEPSFAPADDSGGSAEGAGGGSGEIDLATAVRPGDREIIYTADMEIGAKDVESASEKARDVVTAADGFLFAATESDLDAEHPSVSLTFKVPPDAFDDVLDSLAELGEVTDRTVNADDVTGQVVDLEARLDAARTSADRLRELLAQSGNVADLLSVERELAAREAQVESLAGQLAALRDQVDLATITLQIVEPSDTTPEVSDDIPGFVEGLKSGATAFVNVVLILATVLGFALPFLGVAALLALPVLLVVRRRRAGREKA